MVIDEVQKDRLYWIENDVLGLEDLLHHHHVPLSDLFFFVCDVSVNLPNMAVILGQLNLARYRIHPLIQIVLRFSAQHVLPVLVLNLEAVLLTLVQCTVDYVYLCVAEHDQVEVFVLFTFIMIIVLSTYSIFRSYSRTTDLCRARTASP